MIVDAMTFPEISDYLKKTSFSTKSTKGIESIYHRKRTEYQREIKKWIKHHPKEEKYRIFRPTYYKGENDETQTIIFYSDRPRCIYYVSFIVFWKDNRKYLAFKPSPILGKGRVIFFSYHALHRYAERFMEDPNTSLDDEYLGDLLIFNAQFIERRYTYEGKETAALISTDGAWLYYPKDEENPVIRTFISENEYFNEQAELDKEAIEELKKYKKKTWDNTIDRYS